MIGWHDIALDVGVDDRVLVRACRPRVLSVTAMAKGRAEHSGPRPSEILSQRYARGEMNSEEYRETLESTHEPRS